MINELKNCPFCNSNKIQLFTNNDSRNSENSSGFTLVFIACPGCHMGTRNFASKQEAITSWNKRFNN